MRRFLLLMASPLAALLVVVAANVFLKLSPMPVYGSWTGIRPLERKLELLRKFASEGPVDAIVVGNSVVDFGFSAAIYAERMSEHLKRPYRVFNFATGGAEFTTFPALYEISSLIVKPAEFVVTAAMTRKRPEEEKKASPTSMLKAAPIGEVLGNEGLALQLDYWRWRLPLLEKAAALRDILVFGEYRNLKAEGMDAYEIGPAGDRFGYTAAGVPREVQIAMRAAFEEHGVPYPGGPSTRVNHFFSRPDIAALAELKRLAKRDGVKLTVAAHAHANMLREHQSSSQSYQTARRDYFTTLAGMLDAGLLDPIESMTLPDFAIMDTTHINHHGAVQFSQALFAQAVGASPLQPLSARAPSLDPVYGSSPTFNNWSALVRLEPLKPAAGIAVQIVQSIAVPELPKNNLFLALRQPDGSDIVVPAQVAAPGTFHAAFSLSASADARMFIVRLLYDNGTEKVALNAPLASYNWIVEN